MAAAAPAPAVVGCAPPIRAAANVRWVPGRLSRSLHRTPAGVSWVGSGQLAVHLHSFVQHLIYVLAYC